MIRRPPNSFPTRCSSDLKSVTANFAVTTYQVSAGVSGNGSASITDQGVDGTSYCNGSSSCLAAAGDQITITATATSGNYVSSWSGDACDNTPALGGTTSTCTFSSLGGTKRVTATNLPLFSRRT